MSDIKIKRDVWQSKRILIGCDNYYTETSKLLGNKRAIEIAKQSRVAVNTIIDKMLDQ